MRESTEFEVRAASRGNARRDLLWDCDMGVFYTITSEDEEFAYYSLESAQMKIQSHAKYLRKTGVNAWAHTSTTRVAGLRWSITFRFYEKDEKNEQG